MCALVTEFRRVLFRSIFAQRDRAEWCRRLEAGDVPHAPMYTTAEVPDDPQARHLQLFVETEHPVVGTFRTVRSPVSFDGERALEVTAPPLLGEHNAELRGGWKLGRASCRERVCQ